MTMATEPLHFDVAILGGGSAGYAAARTAAAAGRRTVVLEGAPELGGLCILRGCMPTKALLYAAEVLHLARSGPTWGLASTRSGFDFGAVMARKDAVIREFADYRARQLEESPFELIREHARFVDPHVVEMGDGRRLRADHFVIATGSVVSPPPLAQLTEVGYLTSDDALDLKRLPRSLIVLGGGPVAIEFAQFFARMDVRVTVIQRSPHILKEFDVDASVALEKALRREGIELHTGTHLVDAARRGDSKAVTFDQGQQKVTVEAEEILVALGRTPNVRGLNLDAAGVRLTRGRIVTDGEMRTSASHIYAAGDCTGPHEIVHVAIAQGEIAARNIGLSGGHRSIDYRLLTSVVFTEPQVAVVGLTERGAQRDRHKYLAAQHPFADHGKSIIMNALDGFVKLLADPRTGEILGGACVGPLAGELIHEVVVAMAGRMTVGQFAAVPHYHPTLAEIWTYPAEELAAEVDGQRVGE
jgi:pyruvate/2-oxoglutarate dehydrogenase complex dihydrolipoamide dehydrogenase (E3) component